MREKWHQNQKTQVSLLLIHLIMQKIYLRYVFFDGGMVEIGRVTRVPIAIPIVEIELHEMAGNGSEGHLKWLVVNGVVEFEYLVVSGAAVSHSKPTARENTGCRFSHGWLLRHVQCPNWAPTAACHSENGFPRGVC